MPVASAPGIPPKPNIITVIGASVEISHLSLLRESQFGDRRLYRSGESEYLLNDGPCRPARHSDLFSGTGLSGVTTAIIEQRPHRPILSPSRWIAARLSKRRRHY